MSLRSGLVDMMVEAVEEASRGLRRDFSEVERLQVSRKGPGDFVSEADRRAERTLCRLLALLRPEAGMCTEESPEQPGSVDARWIVDPLDGTGNFLHGLPHFAVSVAYEEGGLLRAGVVYDVCRDEVFWAEESRGCFLDNRRLRVSVRQRLDDSLWSYGGRRRGGDGSRRQRIAMARPDVVAGVRSTGSLALDMAYVAAGRLDGSWCQNPEAWDIAAGQLLVREAGGYVSDGSGRQADTRPTEQIASNGRLHRAFLEFLAAD